MEKKVCLPKIVFFPRLIRLLIYWIKNHDDRGSLWDDVFAQDQSGCSLPLAVFRVGFEGAPLLVAERSGELSLNVVENVAKVEILFIIYLFSRMDFFHFN